MNPGARDAKTPVRDGERALAPKDHFGWGLLALALLTRLIWVGFVHPPGETIFSDMARYTERATLLLSGGAEAGLRSMAWQSWGTHALLAMCMKLFGSEPPWTGTGLVWGSMSALSVMMSYRLARRVLDGEGPPSRAAKSVGLIALFWYPHLAGAGYFLSETPFMLAMLVLTEACVAMWRGEGAERRAAVAAAACVALRPQALVFMGLAALLWFVARARGVAENRARAGQLAFVALAVGATLVFSVVRFEYYAGYWGGIAETANMNLTAGRCHNVVTQAFRSQAALERSEATGSTRDGRRVSLPGFRLLATTGDAHPLALRPALGGETIRFVGSIGDPKAHADIRRQCYAQTGVLEQLRYSLVNLSLLWVFNVQWPDAADSDAPRWQLGLSQTFGWIFFIGLWVPSGLGVARALRRWRDHPGLALCALQLSSLFAIAAIFFGTIRVRSPYDPYAFILGVWVIQASLAARKGRNERT